MNLQDRINECLLEKKAKKVDLARATKSPRATISDWTSGKTKKLSGEKLLLAAEFFNVKPKWLEDGSGEKYWKKQVGYLGLEYELNVNTVTSETNASQKLIEIIDAADKAMNDSKCEFTVDERIDYYLGTPRTIR